MRVVVRRASHDQRGSALRRFPLSVSERGGIIEQAARMVANTLPSARSKAARRTRTMLRSESRSWAAAAGSSKRIAETALSAMIFEYTWASSPTRAISPCSLRCR